MYNKLIEDLLNSFLVTYHYTSEELYTAMSAFRFDSNYKNLIENILNTSEFKQFYRKMIRTKRTMIVEMNKLSGQQDLINESKLKQLT